MTEFTFDLKLSATICVTASDLAEAREAIDAMVCRVFESSSWVGKTSGLVSDARRDGDAYLVAIDGKSI